MATQIEPLVIGQAMVVHGTVRAASSDGVTHLIQPNSPIHLDDRIDTGSDGAVSIIFNDVDNSQLDLDRMTDMVIDQDVFSVNLLDLSDVTAEAGLLHDLLQNWESIEPAVALEAVLSETDASGTEETAAADSIPGLDGSSETVAASSEAGDDGLGSIDDDLDMTNLIPPPDDAA